MNETASGLFQMNGCVINGSKATELV